MINGDALLGYVYLLFYLFYQFYLSKTLIVIYLFKLLRLLHDRIDPTVELLKKKPQTLKRKRANSASMSSIPPKSAPSWCLTQEALKRFNRSSDDIPIYDYSTDETQNHTDNNVEDEEETSIPNRKNKRKKKSSKKRSKKHK